MAIETAFDRGNQAMTMELQFVRQSRGTPSRMLLPLFTPSILSFCTDISLCLLRVSRPLRVNYNNHQLAFVATRIFSTTTAYYPHSLQTSLTLPTAIMWYHISEANEYLVVTGANIDDVRIVKKAFVYPWQKVARISVTPMDFPLNLQAMSLEKLQFALPAVFTIGPDNNRDALKKYALLLSGAAEGLKNNLPPSKNGVITPTQRAHVQDIVKGIIEGETRVIISSMTMEEIFKERQIFKQKVSRSKLQRSDFAHISLGHRKCPEGIGCLRIDDIQCQR